MKGNDVVMRLAAYSKGQALPHGETLHVPKPGKGSKPDEMMVVAFLRMGGESAPWGVAYGRPGKKPNVLSVADPRVRDDVAAMMAEFAPDLLEHFFHPEYSNAAKSFKWAKKSPIIPTRQIWLPNGAHLEMLHCLAYAYHRTKYGTTSRQELLRAFARLNGWLFREANRVGQTVTMVATDVLTEAFTFPADDLRQGHLGFLLAWLDSKAKPAARKAAAEDAERHSISTTLDPDLEKTQLQPLVERYNDAKREGDAAVQSRTEASIGKILKQQLLRRWELTVAAIDVLAKDSRRENAGVATLMKASQTEHYKQYIRVEQKNEDSEDGPPFFPSPETDRHPAAAGARYYVNASSQELRDRLLVHDDRQMQAEFVAVGDAIEGTIVAIEAEKVGKATHVYWTVATDGRLPLRLREGGTLCPIGCQRRHLEIVDISQPEPEVNHFELFVSAGYTLEGDGLLRADDKRLLRTKVVLVPPPMDGISRRKSAAIWNADGPGAWLTHAVPKGRGMDLPEDVAENLEEIGGRR